MRCFYDTGDKLCDFIGETMNGLVWVHKTDDGSDWGKRVSIHNVFLDKKANRTRILVAQESERAVAVYVYLGRFLYSKLTRSRLHDFYPPSWCTFAGFFEETISVEKNGKILHVRVNGIWREPMYELIHVSDDAIHVIPRSDDSWDVFVPAWYMNVLSEEALVEF